MTKSTISRRSFLTGAAGAGALAAAGALAGCSPSTNTGSSAGDESDSTTTSSWRTQPDMPTDISETIDADIVVVGAGSSGLSAAVQAAEKGAKVVLLEKNPFVGGCSTFAEGLFGIESEWNRLRSDTLTKEKAFEGLMERHAYEIDSQMTRDYVWGTAENLEWLSKHDIKFQVVRMTPWEEATWHEIGEYKGKRHGEALVTALKDHADRLGVQTLTSTPAVSLIADKDGAIVGVNAKSKADNYTISARAVILSSGSFGDSKEKVAKWAHRDPEFWKPSIPIGKTGDGIQMALDKGAALGRPGFIGHLGTEGKGIQFAGDLYTTSWQPSALWVNSDGVRFVNEEVAYSFSQAANAIYSQFGHSAWSIFDESQVKYMEEKGVDSGVGVIVPVGQKLVNLRKEIRAALDAGSDGFKAADSVAGLAKEIGVPAEALEAAVADYNRMAANEHDGQFFKKDKYLRPLDTSKLYAIRLRSYFFSAYGGLNTNRRFQVLDTNNKPIRGLYASGLEVSNMIGHTYTTWSSGHAFGFACYSGRHAALNAAADIGK